MERTIALSLSLKVKNMEHKKTFKELPLPTATKSNTNKSQTCPSHQLWFPNFTVYWLTLSMLLLCPPFKGGGASSHCIITSSSRTTIDIKPQFWWIPSLSAQLNQSTSIHQHNRTINKALITILKVDSSIHSHSCTQNHNTSNKVLILMNCLGPNNCSHSDSSAYTYTSTRVLRLDIRNSSYYSKIHLRKITTCVLASSFLEPIFLTFIEQICFCTA